MWKLQLHFKQDNWNPAKWKAQKTGSFNYKNLCSNDKQKHGVFKRGKEQFQPNKLQERREVLVCAKFTKFVINEPKFQPHLCPPLVI